MTPTRQDFEAMMPEPVGYRTRYRSEPEMIGHYPWTYADVERRRRKYDRPECEYEDLHTADQLLTAIQAADKAATERERERAAMVAAQAAHDAAIRYANGYVVDFDVEVAAAIRSTP